MARENDTKTEQLRTHVFARILRGDYEPGGRLPTEREMAEAAGVSRVTVRRAYAELEAAGILRRVQGSGTRISTDLRGHGEPPREVALVSAQLDRFSVEFAVAMEAALRRRDALLVLKLTDSPQSEEEAVLDLMSKGVRNIVLWPQGDNRLADLSQRLRVLGANLVFFDRIVPGPCADFIGLDNSAAIAALLGHAQSSGCRRFVFVGISGLEVDSNRQRHEAFLAYCAERNLAHGEYAIPWNGDRQAAARQILRKEGPDDSAAQTAILCANDSLALLLRRIEPALPHLYGIDGFADPRMDGIVTVQQPLSAMAARAVALLFDQQKLGDRWTAQHVRMKGELLA